MASAGNFGTTEGETKILVLGVGAIALYALWSASRSVGTVATAAADVATSTRDDLSTAGGNIIDDARGGVKQVWGGAGSLYNNTVGRILHTAPSVDEKPEGYYAYAYPWQEEAARQYQKKQLEDWRYSTENPYRGSI